METTRPSLLLRIRDRSDTDAWRAFDAIYRPMLHRFALSQGLTRDDAEDVRQECLAAIYDRIGDFAYDPARGRFKGWLKTMVNNRVRNLRRHRAEAQAGTADLQRPQHREPAPEEAFDRIWAQEHLWHCLRAVREEVGEKTYAAFERYVIERRPIDEICRALGLTANNVYTIKWRLTEKVAARMKALLGDED